MKTDNQILLSQEESTLYIKYLKDNKKSISENIKELEQEFKDETRDIKAHNERLIEQNKELIKNTYIPELLYKIEELRNLDIYQQLIKEGDRKVSPYDISLKDDRKILKLFEHLVQKEIDSYKKEIYTNPKKIEMDEVLSKPIEERQPYYKELLSWIKEKF